MLLTTSPHDAAVALHSQAIERQAAFLLKAAEFRKEVGRAVIGVHDPSNPWCHLFEALLMGLVSGGHISVVGPPGEGKTHLLTSVSTACALSYASFQGTAETVPSEVLGMAVEVFDENGRKKFAFRPGPAFKQLVLIDEYNALSPPTMTALRSVLWGRTFTDPTTEETVTVPLPGIKLCAYNPVVYGATFDIPEALHDRFLMSILLPRASKDSMGEVLANYDTLVDPLSLAPKLTAEDLLAVPADVKLLYPAKSQAVAREYALRLVMATRTGIKDERGYIVDETPTLTSEKDRRKLYRELIAEDGLSTRAATLLFQAARFKAYLEGAQVVTEDHVRRVAPDVLRQRIYFAPAGKKLIGDRGIDRFVADIIRNVKVT